MLRWVSLLLAPTCLGFALGCEVQIGDECTTAAECSQEEPRLCLTQALEHYPGGYCTIFNCDPGSCPSEAVCVGYRSNLSSTPECSGALADTRLQRTFCMRSCNSGSDCRSGYACLDLGESNPWGAVVLEKEGRNTKVCALAYSGPEAPEDRPSDVCRNEPGAATLPTSTPESPAAIVDASVPMGVDASVPMGDASVPMGVDAGGVAPTQEASMAAPDAAVSDASAPGAALSDPAVPAAGGPDASDGAADAATLGPSVPAAASKQRP